MKTERAYSLLTIKSVDDGERVIVGIATTPSTDRYSDIVEPKGAVFELPVPLLWQHDSGQPIGHVTAAKVTASGIEITAKLVDIDTPGTLKDRLDEAWQSIKSGLVRGLSIGFRAIETARIADTWGVHFLKWEWLELSAVTIPANADATIQTIKSFDTQQRAASGRSSRSVVRLSNAPGVTGTTPVVPMPKDTKMNIQEQIAAFEAKRAAHADRMSAVMSKAADEGRTLDEAEQQEYDGLASDVKALDDHLVRLRTHEKSLVARATPVTQTNSNNPDNASAVRGGNGSITIQRQVPKGVAFTRYAMCLAASKGQIMQAVEIAKRFTDSTPEVEVVLRAAAAAGTTTDPTWAGNLVAYTTMANEFIELLRPMTIIGKFGTGSIPSLRRVPFNIRMPSQTGGSTVGWVGEGAPKPVGELSFGEVTLRWAKAAGIVVLTEELVRASTPSAEALVQADLTKAIAQFLDGQFVDPSVTEVSDVSPASITNGVTPVTASGTDADAARADVKSVFERFIAVNLTPTNGVWIMSSSTALALSLMRNPLGQKEFPDITMLGGSFEGLPVIVSESVPTNSNGSLIILANASDILLADDGGVTLDVSREASLQMSTTPSAGAQQLVSLWQNNLVGLRAERFINWKRRRTGAVAYIQNVNYG